MIDKLEKEVNRLNRCSERHDILNRVLESGLLERMKGMDNVKILGCDVCKLLEEHKYKECLDRFDIITK